MPGISNFSLQSMTWAPGGVKIRPADTRSMKPEVPGKVVSVLSLGRFWWWYTCEPQVLY